MFGVSNKPQDKRKYSKLITDLCCFIGQNTLIILTAYFNKTSLSLL